MRLIISGQAEALVYVPIGAIKRAKDVKKLREAGKTTSQIAENLGTTAKKVRLAELDNNGQQSLNVPTHKDDGDSVDAVALFSLIRKGSRVRFPVPSSLWSSRNQKAQQTRKG